MSDYREKIEAQDGEEHPIFKRPIKSVKDQSLWYSAVYHH